MTRLPIPFLVLAFVAFQAPQAGHKNGHPDDARTHNPKQADKSENAADGPRVVVANQSLNCEPSDQPTKSVAADTSDHSHDWIDKLNALSTSVIAAFTVLLFLGLIWQLQTTRNTERAWVIASPTDRTPEVAFIPGGETNLERHIVSLAQHTAFGCTLKSTGNTPARLVEFAMRYCKVDAKVDAIANIPKTPEFGDVTILNDLPLAPGDNIAFVQFLEPSSILTKIEWTLVARGEVFLYAFGIIKYRDVYNRLHETRFGYLYHFPQGGDPREKGFHREGMPSAYNGAT